MERTKSAALLFSVPVASYHGVNLAAGEVYEAVRIDPAAKKAECAETFDEIANGKLPDSCSPGSLESQYANPSSSVTEWELRDGVLYKVETENTELAPTSVIMKDASDNLNSIKEARGEVEHFAGILGGTVALGCIVGVAWKRTRQAQRVKKAASFESGKDVVVENSKPGKIARFVGHLGLNQKVRIVSEPEAEDQPIAEESKQSVEV